MGHEWMWLVLDAEPGKMGFKKFLTTFLLTTERSWLKTKSAPCIIFQQAFICKSKEEVQIQVNVL